ncbi:MAG: GH32 C-terminal domain-containing protein [Pirellulales bacterium]|nr:GH32 C-terminal domain-containing protein [Pirellulales bacterium]
MIQRQGTRNSTLYTLLLLAIALAHGITTTHAANPKHIIGDKTMVAWVTLYNLTQGGGSVLTLENSDDTFDAIVFGEIQKGKWMAGSDGFKRTHQQQDAFPMETAGAKDLVQIAIVYRGKEVSIFRNGKPYASYTMKTDPLKFSSDSVVLMGLRHRAANTERFFVGSIDDARIYDRALDAKTIAALKPNVLSDPKPLAWWSFENGSTEDHMGTFKHTHLVAGAKIADGKLILPDSQAYLADGKVHPVGGSSYLIAGANPPRTRETEDWPTYHIIAWPDEKQCRPYDANGCIFWKGKYHLMYIYQDRNFPHGGHSWGHAVSTDLVNWTFLPPALLPERGDKDIGIFSGNAFVNKDGVPMLCWFGINAGVCVATAEDDELIRWKKHPKNPLIPIPEKGTPEYGKYRVWDPYMWLEGDTYYCLLGGNQHPDGEDTLILCRSKDMVDWEIMEPFYRAEPSWTVPGEDCSCPDFFKLGNKHVLLCISHKVGGRCYIGRYEKNHFYPEQHVRMNWPGGQFFAPESLIDDKGRRIIWAWVTDTRCAPTQKSTGSGVQSLPRVLSLDKDNILQIRPPKELETLRRNHRGMKDISLQADSEVPLKPISGDCLELALEIDPGKAKRVGLKVRCAPNTGEETAIWYDAAAKTLTVDTSKSTLREDVVYTHQPLTTGGIKHRRDYKDQKFTVDAPLSLGESEPLRLRVFLDKPMLEVFANDRQCITQQIFPSSKEAKLVKVFARGGPASIRRVDAWDMAPAKFIDKRKPAGAENPLVFEDSFEEKPAAGWTWLRENPKAWRIRDGGLEIHIEPGLAHNVKNALLRSAPDRGKGTYTIDVTVTNQIPPTKQYEQAGITWYNGGKPVFKLVKERIDGKTYIIPGKVPMPSKSVQLRLVVSGNKYIAQFRPNGKGEFLTAASGSLPPVNNDQVSIQCYHGPTDAEHWIRFDDFRITKLEKQ